MDEDRYKIVTSNNLPELTERVNNYLRRGWHPLGAPFPNPVTRNQQGKYCQALIKPESDYSKIPMP